MPFNLFSASICEQYNMYVHGKTRTIRYIDTDKEAASYEMINDQPFLQVSSKAQISAQVTAMPVSAETWHRRLGHISYPYIEKTSKITTGIKSLDISDTALCEPCELAKSLRMVSTKPQTRSSEPFNCIHFDVLGVKPPALNGDNYAIIFTDDCTRIRWSYSFKVKGEASYKVIDFMKLICTQFNQNIKTL